MKRIIIDTDMGTDDAVALIMALRSPALKVEAITIVSGNVPVEMATKNALIVLGLCDQDVPVFVGAAAPLRRPPHYAFHIHGATGLGDTHWPEPIKEPERDDAVAALIGLASQYQGELEMVTLGPLTNLALALKQEPQLAKWIHTCMIMGGAIHGMGNVTPAAEYNIWSDPEAANMVFQSDLAIVLVGWELCAGDAALVQEELDMLASDHSKLTRFVAEINRFSIKAKAALTGEYRLHLPDPLAMAIAIDRSICMKSSAHAVMVETDSDLTRGVTVIDRHFQWGKNRNVEICWQVDVKKWKELLFKLLKERA
jgi:purine nucleosidase